MVRLFHGLLIGAFVATPAVALPRAIYVMRHLEREVGPDPDLNARGAANAAQLASWFERDPPRIIYVTPFKRTQQTAAPLAARLGIAPISYDPKVPESMLAAVRAARHPVLIVGHSNTVPKLVEALGGPKASGDLADSDYGRIWVFRRGKMTIAELGSGKDKAE